MSHKTLKKKSNKLRKRTNKVKFYIYKNFFIIFYIVVTIVGTIAYIIYKSAKTGELNLSDEADNSKLQNNIKKIKNMVPKIPINIKMFSNKIDELNNLIKSYVFAQYPITKNVNSSDNNFKLSGFFKGNILDFVEARKNFNDSNIKKMNTNLVGETTKRGSYKLLFLDPIVGTKLINLTRKLKTKLYKPISTIASEKK